MPKNLESKNIEQLLAEADALIQQMNSDAQSTAQEGTVWRTGGTLPSIQV